MNKFQQLLHIIKNHNLKDFKEIYITKRHGEYQYLNLLKKILKEGQNHDDRTGTGTYRVWGEKIEFDLSSGQLPLLTTKKMAVRLIIEELSWFLKGNTNVKKLQEKNVKIWNGNGSKEECNKFGRKEGDLGPIYGHQWRNFNASKRDIPLEEDYWSEKNKRWVNRAYNDDGYDQIKYIIDTIQNNPNSRRIIFSGWHASEAHIVNPPPCHTLYQFQVDQGKLNVSLLSRSSDTLLGQPYNIASLALLCHIVAICCDLKPGKIVQSVNDAHLYKDHLIQAKDQISRTPFPFPKIEINKDLKGKGLDGLLMFSPDDIKIIGYNSHEKIIAKMSV